LSKVTDLIQWHEGMFLVPQHFQQLDQRIHELLYHNISHRFPYHRGVISLKIDTVAFTTGHLIIIEIEAIFPDGLCIFYDRTRHHPLELDIKANQETLSQESKLVYISVPLYRKGESNIDGNFPRYIQYEGDLISDEITGQGDQVRIPRLIPNLKLHLGSVPASPYTYIPIMKLSYQNDSFSFEDYIPPILTTNIDSPLRVQVTDISSKLRSRVLSLIERHNPNNDTIIDKDIARTIGVLTPALVLFESIVAQAFLPPYELYISLLRLAGCVAPLVMQKELPLFPPYNHDDIASCTFPLVKYIQSVLDQLHDQYQTIKCMEKNGFFGVKIPIPWSSKRILFGARTNLQANEVSTHDWIDNAIIASEGNLKSVMDRRIRGADRVILDKRKEDVIRVSQDIILFAVNPFSNSMNIHEILYIFNPTDTSATRPIQVNLYIEKDSDI
jgi:type VI secretion system protein ImpJ